MLAAGGIADGRGLAAALALGCDGAVVGTRLWASDEAMGKPSIKAALADPAATVDAVGPDEGASCHSANLHRQLLPFIGTPPFKRGGVQRNDNAALVLRLVWS